MNNENNDVFALVSLVAGVVGLIASLSFFFGIILGILAIVFSTIALKNGTNSRGFAKAGLILGIIAIVLSFLWIVILIIGITSLFTFLN